MGLPQRLSSRLWTLFREESKIQYVTAIELALQIDTSPRKVVSLLRKEKVFPISGKSVDSGRQYLFVKQEAEEFFH